jgi:hypothetical protein
MIIDNYMLENIDRAKQDDYIRVEDIAKNCIYLRKCDLQIIAYQELYDIEKICLK